MISKRVRKTTKSSKRFTYKSFKESLDSLSVVNTTSTLSLSNNARLKHGEDIEDTSFHYNEAVNHWKEINISKNFTEYFSETYTLVNTLPQLLYHKKVIFQKLKDYIDKHDNVSTEPLLDLLVNFVHDLGAEEFMEFYEDAMRSLISLALAASSTNDNDTQTNKLMTNDNVIQWVFTTIAFIFKYMSKSLSSKDGLLKTLDMFYPCLKLTKTQHILRFSAEAISFLFRKANQKTVHAGTCFLKKKLTKEDMLKETEKIALRNSFVIILTESCKNISNTFHTRTLNITLEIILEQSIPLSGEVEMEMVSILCDTLLNLINYSTIDSAKEIYDIPLEYLGNFPENIWINNENCLISSFQVLSTLAFAGSGRSNNSWALFANITEKILKNDNANAFSSRFDEIIGFYFVVVMRNAPMSFLSKFHSTIFSTMKQLKNGRWFLSFIESSLNISKEKTMIFGSKMISDFIIKNWKSHEKQISCFLANTSSKIISDKKSISNGNKLDITITGDFYNNLIEGLNEIFENGENTEENLLAIYWRLLVLQYSKNFVNYEILVKLFLKFFNFDDQSEISSLSIEISGNILSVLSTKGLGDLDYRNILERIIRLLTYTKYPEMAEPESKERLPFHFKEDNKIIKSKIFIDGLFKFLSSIQSPNELALSQLKSSQDNLLSSLSNGLLYPSHELRTSIIDCLSIIYLKSGSSVPLAINLIKSIESINLDLRNSRDLASKVRSLAKLFESEEHKDVDDYSVGVADGKSQYLGIAVKWIFGMLSNKFKPVWDAIFEVIGKIIVKEESLVWELTYFFLYKIYNSKPDDEELFDNIDKDNLNFESVDFSLLDTRINDSFKSFGTIFYNYYNLDGYFIELANRRKMCNVFSGFMRYQSLKILMAVPSLGEKKARFLVPVILASREDDTYTNEDDRDIEEDISKDPQEFEDWNTKEKNMLIELFGKFKNIKNIYKSTEIYNTSIELLCSKNVPTQKAALKVILAYKNPQIRKFSENLDNIVNSNTFKDEVVTFFSTNEAENLDDAIDVILRILYGKSKVKITTNSKKTQKNSILKLLTSLSEDYVTRFLKLGYSSINYEILINKYIETNVDSDSLFKRINITQRLLRKLLGFVNLLADSISEFKNKFPHALETTLKPLIFSIGVSQYFIDNCTESQNEAIFVKIAKSVRQSGLKDLSKLFSLLSRQVLQQREDTASMNVSFNWSDYYFLIYDLIIKKRLDKFSVENLQAPSSLMLIILSWAKSPELLNILYFDEFRPIRAILELFENPNCKNSVLFEILTFVNDMITGVGEDVVVDENMEFSQNLIIKSCLKKFPDILSCADVSKDVISVVVKIILLFIEKQLINSEDTIVVKTLLDTLMNALDRLTPEKNRYTIAKTTTNIELKTNILTAVGKMLSDLKVVGGFSDVEHIYKMVSKFFMFYSDTDFRKAAVSVMVSIGGLYEEFFEIGNLIADLNSYGTGRIGEIDYEKRISSYACLSEEKYDQFTALQWLPFIYNSLFFMEDEELGIRTNARHALSRFVDGMSKKYNSIEEAQPAIKLLKEVVLETVKFGLRHKDEKIEKEYVSLLAHIIEYSKYYTDLSDMKILFYNNDDEANFFSNINHIQIHRRQRAVNRLPRFAPHISPSNISRYLIPIVERFVYTGKTENLRQLANDAIETVGILTRYVTWNQYKALMRRYVSFLKSELEYFHDMVRLVIACSKALLISVKNLTNNDEEDEEMSAIVNHEEHIEKEFNSNQLSKNVDHDKAIIKEFTKKQEEIDYFIIGELNPKLETLLLTRDEETASIRITISEAMVSMILCLSNESKEIQLPAVLTKISQTLRSKSEELRDAVRKSLGKIVSMLGTRYLRFVIKELKTALKRGPQLHILSFTVHYLLVLLNGVIGLGELNDCAELIMDIIMEDTFGAASKEKEALEYSSKTKEVKHNKSFDTAEILATYISLDEFNSLLKPVKLLLSENINLKTQNKLDELLKRIAMGFNHNPESSSQTSLVLCYEIFTDSKEFLQTTKFTRKDRLPTAQEEHFLVQLDAKPMKTEMEFSKYSDSLRKFSMELVRNILSRNEQLVTFSNLSGFIPLLEQSLRSENDGLIIACLKVLNFVILLPLDEEATKRLNVAARRVLKIFKNTPNTNSDISQACLKFLAAIVRHKNEDVELKDSAVSYILVRLLPDLENPNRQGLAFNFLKAVLSKHIMLADIYDVMEKVSKILVTNHAREVRSMARSTYFQFIMEYDQGKGKLEKEFKSMIGNLNYPAEAGRLSVLELIKSILIKSTDDLLLKIATSFFVALSNVAVVDDSLKCRENASDILRLLMSKLAANIDGEKSESLHSAVEHIDSFLSSWIKQKSNGMLIRCGFQIYKIYLESLGLNENSELNKLFMKRLSEIFKAASDGDSIFDEDDEDFEEQQKQEWELVYSGLNCFGKIVQIEKEAVFVSKREKYEKYWRYIIALLLYPHSWVRSSSCRLMGILLSNLGKVEFLNNSDLQTIAYRSIRQLAAPKITIELGNQIIKNLIFITMNWEKNGTKYLDSKKNGEEEEEEEESVTENKRFDIPVEWVFYKLGAIMRNDYRSQDFVNSKKCAIKLCAMIIQILSVDKLYKTSISESIILSLYNFTENGTDDEDSQDKKEMFELSSDCLKLLEGKIGVSDYSKMFSKVRSLVVERRVERRTKRAQMKVTNPEAASKRKMKKHAKIREKRKAGKDENGLYHGRKRARR